MREDDYPKTTRDAGAAAEDSLKRLTRMELNSLARTLRPEARSAFVLKFTRTVKGYATVALMKGFLSTYCRQNPEAFFTVASAAE